MTVWPFELDPINTYAYWNNAFTKEECESIIKFGNDNDLKKAVVGAGDKTKKEDSLRDSDIFWIDTSDESKWIFERLAYIITSLNKDYFKFDLFGITESLQFTKYSAPGGKYGKHIDCATGVHVRKLSLSLQLSDSDDYKGGDLNLHTHDKPILMDRAQGSVAVFPSYVLHEVTPVTEGTRYSLVAWVTGKPFK